MLGVKRRVSGSDWRTMSSEDANSYFLAQTTWTKWRLSSEGIVLHHMRKCGRGIGIFYRIYSQLLGGG